ncbi:sodium:solute symporter family protein [Roseivirga pacifica]|uniref:sodium:solute symporter family protein n=1 Tax=Roseivirga pacifica TaxID=1267423 RepID=UPI0020942CCE|nr:sodium:solute symporter family protein [Roseivirga pacifica]MCO6359569.1 Na+:solute symporter [Roseivirga pacifica]MCO6366939.1 Na+:solute symporter [Roseivirga pacifica]MCO6370529.1 Na+:solute symporter [Roseivirga pacifica]MCO6374596.1 Na+:solute symporter [Roseivirga pacifica]MCO6379854.1 Na+:solute symporter [Roseivirga pacifica]
MNLSTLDWGIIALFFVVFLVIGIRVSKQAGSSAKEFFLSGRNMPWWLIGVSMVATTFSADTPNLVTDIVRTNGVAGNWSWWAFLVTGMVTVFIYAKLWRKSGVMTDLEFYEIRYSGKAARFLRAFRAIYLGFFFNVMIMATVTLAGIKIGGVLFGLSPVQSILIASIITVIYSSLGGLRGVILTDFLQFIIAMVGSVGAAIYVMNMPEIGGLDTLLTHPNVADKLNILPDFSDPAAYVPLIIVPLAVQWWSVWYPGAEPGGGGYIAQRMLSAKNEKHAVLATLLFNVTHYALRPWPWIIIALASLVVYPDLASIQTAFPDISEKIVKDDLGYSAMLLNLPSGLLGIVVASLIAAFMSTISTHLNWGSSYLVHDFYERFVKPEASEKEKVMVGRISTVVLMIFTGLLALVLENALEAFEILLQIGAGTGSIFILRWFWWRVNAWSEISGMIVSFIVAVLLKAFPTGLESHWELILGVGLTTVTWVLVTFLTKPEDDKTLEKFYNLVTPYGMGWNRFKAKMQAAGVSLKEGTGKFSADLMAVILGIFIVYSALFSIGMLVYGEVTNGVILAVITVASSIGLIRIWRKLSF